MVGNAGAPGTVVVRLGSVPSGVMLGVCRNNPAVAISAER